jgi:hypothetical protein
MPKDLLQELFREKKKKAKPANVNWAAKRDAWIKAVKALYDTVTHEYLGGAKDDVEIAQTDVVVTERNIGEYHIPQLVLQVGDEQVVFSPVGINVVGAQGRVDVEGDRGATTLIWREDGGWNVVLSRAPTLRLVPLNADSLAEILRGIMRP